MASSRADKLRELHDLRARVLALEGELGERAAPASGNWREQSYLSYYATTGFFLGMIAAVTSLMANVVGAAAFGKHPLELVRVYLTFGLGEQALSATSDNDGLALAMGCCLYIATGMLLGIAFQLVLYFWTDDKSVAYRLVVASVLGLAVWIVNYYLILSWLQPVLFGDAFIVKLVPIWVAAGTHLIFAWTMALVYPWGRFAAYRPESAE